MGNPRILIYHSAFRILADSGDSADSGDTILISPIPGTQYLSLLLAIPGTQYLSLLLGIREFQGIPGTPITARVKRFLFFVPCTGSRPELLRENGPFHTRRSGGAEMDSRALTDTHSHRTT